MTKFKKSILIIGIIIIVIAASLSTALALWATGTIKTDPIELVYQVKDAYKVYDGQPLKATEYRLDSGELAANHHEQVEFLGSQTSVGSSVSDLSVRIYDDEGYNVTNNYKIKVIGGELSVAKKPISVDLPSQKVVYNGSKVLFEEYRITEGTDGELVNGHKIYGSAPAQLMNVGDTLPDDLNPLVYDVVGNDVTENYDIDFSLGTIEVIPRYVSVRPLSFEKVYDGVEVVANDIEYLDGSLVEGQYAKYSINYGLNNKFRDVTAEEVSVTEYKVYDVIDGKEVEVTSNYDVDAFETGTYKITPRPVTITGKSASWVYSGEENSLANDTDALDIVGLAEGDELIDVNYTAAITDVGMRDNVFNVGSFTCADNNYDVTVIYGTLEVTPFDMEIKTASKWKYYDGKALKEPDYEVTLANSAHKVELAEGETVPSYTDAGKWENAFKVCVKDGGGKDITSNYNLIYKYGTLEIKARPVIVTLPNDSKPYKGKTQLPDLSKMKIQTMQNSFTDELKLSSESFEVVANVKEMTDVGEYSYTVKFAESLKDVASNYELEITNRGYFEITKIPLYVNTASTVDKDAPNGHIYDGTAATREFDSERDLVAPAVGESVPLPVDGQEAMGPHVYPSRTDVGETLNEYKVTVRETESGRDVTFNYDINYTYGTIKVSPRDVTVELKNYTGENAFVFNNSAVTLRASDSIISITSDGESVDASLLDKDDFTIVCETEMKNVGADYKYSVKITESAKSKNFTVTCQEGTGKVEIKGADLTVKIKDVTRTYNGLEAYVDPYDAIQSISDASFGLTRENFIVKFATEGEHVNVNKYPFTVEFAEGTAEDKKLSPNFNLKVENFSDAASSTAMLTIEKYILDITTASEEFVYDGKEHSNGTFTNGLLAHSSHKITLGTQTDKLTKITEVGSTANVLKLAVYAVDKDVTGNYDLTTRCKNGTLKVVKREIKVTTPDVDAVYDGKPHSDGNVKVTGLPDDWEAVVPETLPELTDNGSISNRFEVTIKKTGGREIAGKNIDVSYTYGKITVDRCPVTVTTGSASRPFNNRPLQCDTFTTEGLPVGFTASLPEPATEDAPEVVAEGGESAINSLLPYITEVGTKSNKFGCDIIVKDDRDKDVSDNFNLTYVYGTLEIMPLTVKVDLKDLDADYNGEVFVATTDNAILAITEYNSEDGLNSIYDGILEKTDFEIIYSSAAVDAGTYTYTVKISDDTLAKNTILKQSRANIVVNKMGVTLSLKNGVAYTFDNTAKTIKASDVVASVLYGGMTVDSKYLTVADLTVICDREIKYASDESYDYTVKIADGYKARNIELTGNVDGTVKVNKADVDVTLKTQNFTYSGAQPTLVPAAAVTTNSALLGANDFTLTVVTEFIDAGTYTYTADPVNEVYAENFNITFKGSTTDNLVIGKLDVTVNVRDFIFTYDKNGYTVNSGELTAPNCVVINTPLLSASDFVLCGEPGGLGAKFVNQGEYSYKAQKGTSASDNFNYTFNTGKIIIKPLEVTVTLGNFSKEYDGNEFELKEEHIAGISPTVLEKSGFIVSYVKGGTHTDVGKYAITAAAKSANNNYKLAYVEGSVTITKATLNVTLANLTAEYDGSALPLTYNNAIKSVSVSSVSKNKFSVKFTSDESTLADVGTHSFTVECADETVKKNYSINISSGALTVTPKPVKITTASQERVYNGTPLSNTDVESVGLAAGHTVSAVDADSAPKITDVGSKTNSFACVITGGGKDVTKNYTVTYAYGTLTITPLAVRVDITNNEDFTYTGNVITPNATLAITPAGSGLAATDFEITCSSTIKDAGVYTYTAQLKSAQKANNYELTIGTANVTIDKYQFNATIYEWTEGNAQVYRGGAYTIPSNNLFEAFDTANPDGLTASDFTAVYKGDMTSVGLHQIGAQLVNPSLAKNYRISITEGLLQIRRATINVTLKDFVSTYDGKDVPMPIDEAITSIAGEEGGAVPQKSDFVVYRSGSFVNAGDYTYTVEFGSSELAKNFSFAGATGNVKINQAVIGVTLKDYTYTYSGADVTLSIDQAITAITAEAGGAKPQKADFIISRDSDFVNAGDYTYTVEFASATLAKNFSFAGATGNVKIEKRQLYAKLSNITVSYTDFYDSGDYTGTFNVIGSVSVEGLVGGDRVAVTEATATGTGGGVITLTSMTIEFVGADANNYIVPTDEIMQSAKATITVVPDPV